MRVISNKALLAFACDHADARAPLQTWRRSVLLGTFGNFSDLKTAFRSVDKIGPFFVFDVGGNKFRVVAAIHFDRQILYVRHVLIHREYDQWKP